MNTVVPRLSTDAAHRLLAVGEAGRVPLEWLVEDPRNPRTHFDPIELQQLADSLAKVGQQELMTVRPLSERERIIFRGSEYMIVSGARRSRALKLASIEKAHVIVTEYENDAAQTLAAFVFNVARVGYSDRELMHALVVLEAELGTPTYEQLAAKTNVPKAKVANLLTVHSNADPSVLKRMAPDLPDKKRLRLDVAVELVRFDLDRQKQLLNDLPSCDSAKEQIEWIRFKAKEEGVKLRFRDVSPREQRRFLRVFANKVRRDATALMNKDLSCIGEADRHNELRGIQESLDGVVAQLQVLSRRVAAARAKSGIAVADAMAVTAVRTPIPHVPTPSPVEAEKSVRMSSAPVPLARKPDGAYVMRVRTRPSPTAPSSFPVQGVIAEVWDEEEKRYFSRRLMLGDFKQAIAVKLLKHQREGKPYPAEFPDPASL